jgi:hypothetical protein
MAVQVEPEIWGRPLWKWTNRKATVEFFCFSRMPAPPIVEPKREHDYPDMTWPRELTITSVSREQDPSWVDDFFGGSLRDSALENLGERAHDLFRAQYCHSIIGDFDDPGDLSYLQSAWSAVKWFIDVGSGAMLDAQQRLWIAGDEIKAWKPGFNHAHDVRFIFETDPRDDVGGHLMFTRGMAKFARPEVLVPRVLARAL